MAFNVSQFRSQLTNDGARPSLFEVTMTFPAFVSAPAPGGVNTDITFKARAATLPGDSVSQISVNYFGREIKVAGTRTFPEWTMTVINDEDFGIRNSFELWMSGLNSHVTNIRNAGFRTSNTYGIDVFIKQFSKLGPATVGAAPTLATGLSGSPIKVYQLVGAFPTDVSPIDLNWGDGDSIEEFTVTFAYQWWLTPSGVSVSTTPGETV